MKKLLLYILSLFGMFVALTACSDNDNPEPKNATGNFIPVYLETYAFASASTLHTELQRELTIPITGVITDQVSDYSSWSIDKGWKTTDLRVGTLFTPQNEPIWYNYWAKQYADTEYKATPPSDVKNYAPNPIAIKSISIGLKFDKAPADPNDYNVFGVYNIDYNNNYRTNDNCTSLFRIRFRTYYDFIQNGYSWDGLSHKEAWVEMDLEEFNRCGGAKLIDMSAFYLIAKEQPTEDLTGFFFNREARRYFNMKVEFANGKVNQMPPGLAVYSNF